MVTFLISTKVIAMTPDVNYELEYRVRMERARQLVTFESYSRNIPLEVLQQRFQRMTGDRWRIYFSNPDDFGKKDEDGKDAIGSYIEEYRIPDSWKDWKSRHSFPMAFEYNIATPSYNASIIVIDNCITKFLAIEAPSTQNADEFVKLIEKYRPKCIVKLNSCEEYPAEDYFAYWKTYNPEDSSILVGTQHMRFISYDWRHRAGTDVNSLREVVQSVIDFVHRTDYIAVSCRAGAGRTGTFIAACILAKSIHNQLDAGKKAEKIDVNIDEIIWSISIQRPFAITHCDQYITLYRFVDGFLDSIHLQ